MAKALERGEKSLTQYFVHVDREVLRDAKDRVKDKYSDMGKTIVRQPAKGAAKGSQPSGSSGSGGKGGKATKDQGRGKGSAGKRPTTPPRANSAASRSPRRQASDKQGYSSWKKW